MNEDELLARAFEIMQRRAAAASAPSITVMQLYQRYAASQGQRKSWPVINDRLEPVVKFLADRDVMSLRVIDWSDYRAQRELQEIPTGKRGRHYSAHTINCELTWFKAMINAAVIQGRIPHNPIAMAKGVRTRSKRSTAPSEQDVAALLKHADPRLRVLVLCAADGGMRRTEIVMLHRKWVDHDAKCIRLPGWACKSGRPRTVAATDRMLEAIDDIPEHVRSPYVLTNPDTETHYNEDGVSRWFRNLADAAGIQASPADRRVVLHDLRRGYGSNATRRGVRIEVVSELLGHASLDQTLDYVETGDLDVSAARETFEAGIRRDQERRGPKRIEPSVSDDLEKNKGERK